MELRSLGKRRQNAARAADLSPRAGGNGDDIAADQPSSSAGRQGKPEA